MDRDVTQVAVLGLGRMGTAMAERLSQGGHAVRAWSRTAKQVAGVDVRPTAEEAVAGARVVVLALFDARACQEVLAACLEASAEDAVVVNTSTTGPGEAAELSDIVRERSRAYLHAPVMGSVPAVRSGSLTVLAGSDTVPAEVSRVLEALGTVVRCGDAQTAAAVKLVANQVLGESLAALGRTLASADALGVDRELATDVLERTALGSVVTAKRPWLEGHRGSAAFATEALVKDVRLLAAEVPAVERLLGTLESAGAPPDADVAAVIVGLASAPRTVDTRSRLLVDPGVCVEADLIAPLVNYARGHASGDPTHFRQAFRPTAHIEGLRDGAFTSWDLDTYCGLFTGHPAADESSRRRVVTAVGRAGSTAYATMRLEHGPARLTDTFLLVRDGSGWRIANKVYVREA